MQDEYFHRRGPAAFLWQSLGNQLRYPKGAAGRLVGRAMSKVNRLPYRAAIDALEVQPGDHILELGFGPGRGLAELSTHGRGGHVYGIDQSPDMLQQASNLNALAINAGRMTLALGQFNPLPWHGDSFDRLLMVNVAYFFDRDGADIREAYRVLRPGGRAVIYVTARWTMERWPFCEPDTHRTFDVAALEQLLLQGGFIADDITFRFPDFPFGVSGILAVASKLR
ncbi:MAG: class I SAM-dependent methyltransferase [Flavobacteriaceae bacterium]